MNWIIFLLGLAICCWMAWMVYKKDIHSDVPYPLITAGLRMGSFILLLILLAAPKITFHSKMQIKPKVILLDDRSSSIVNILHKDTILINEEINNLKERLGTDYVFQHYYFNEELTTNQIPYLGEATNISNALQEVSTKNTDQNVAAMLLISDGQYNLGSAPSTITVLNTTPIYCIAIGDTNKIIDVAITKLYFNKTALLNNLFEIKADIKFQQVGNQTFTLALKENNVVIQTKTISTSLQEQVKTIAFLQKATQEGLHNYSIEVSKAQQEVNIQNNQQIATIYVKAEKKQIAIISDAPHPDMQAIVAALDKNKSIQFQSFIGKSPSESDLNKLDAAIYFYPKQEDWKVIAQKIPTWLFVAGNEAGFVGTEKNKINPTSSILFNKQFSLFEINTNTQILAAQLPPLQQHFNTLPSIANAEPLAYQGTNSIWLFEPSRPFRITTLGEGIWKWRMYEYKNTHNHALIYELIQNTITLLTQQERNKKLSVHPIKDAFNNNEVVSFVGSLEDELHNGEQAAVKLTVQCKNKPITSVLMQHNSASLQASIGRLENGPYTYSAIAKVNGITYEDKGAFVVNKKSMEDLTNTANWNELQALANNNNGFATTLSNTKRIIDSIKNNKYKAILKSQEKSIDIIDFKWLFIIAFALLVAEWILRKYWMAQ